MNDPFGDWLRGQAMKIVQDATFLCIGMLLVTLLLSLLFTWLEWKSKMR